MKKLSIFISYSGKDKEIVEAIHERLEFADFEVWRDQSRLEMVEDWSRDIASSLANKTDIVCLIWTKHAAKSKWVKHEWLTARALEKMIIPCRFPHAPDLPKPLFNTQYINFENDLKDINKLIERLKRTTSFKVKYDYTILPPNSYIPFNPNPNFTGRQMDLVELYLKMIGNLNKVGIKQLGTVGMGGIGKTQLVVEFSHRFSFAFNGIYWIQAAYVDSWLHQLVELAKVHLELEIDDKGSSESNKLYLLELQKYFKKHPNTLLIMDNVLEPEFLNNDALLFGLTPLVLGCDLLFTTRKHFELPYVTSQPVDMLSPEAAYRLLTQNRQPETADDQESARAICNAIGYLPLALTLAAGLLAKYPDITYSDYHNKLLKDRLGAIDTGEVAQAELATRHEAAVEATLKSQWDMLSDESAQYLLKLASLFPEASIIPKARLGVIAYIDSDTSDLIPPLDKTLKLLFDLNLVERLQIHNKTALRLHPLVRAFVMRPWLFPAAEKMDSKVAAVQNVMSTYSDPSCLENQFESRGIEQIIGDLRIAISWCEKDAPYMQELELLRRILEREQYILKRTSFCETQIEPILFQQLHYRAFNMGLPEHGQTYYEAAHRQKCCMFKSYATGAFEDPAWIRKFRGHSDAVMVVCMTPDGHHALSGSKDNTLILWDLESGDVIRIFKGHSGSITALTMSADGKRFFSGGADKRLMLWDINSTKPLRTFEGHSKGIKSLYVSSDCRQVLSGSSDKTMILWDVIDGERLQVFNDNSDIQFVFLSPDGKRALSCALRKMTVWDIDSGEALNEVRFKIEFDTAAMSPDAEVLIGWDGYTFKELKISLFHTYGINNLEKVRGFGTTLFDGRAIGYAPLEGHTDIITTVALAADAQHALSGSQDKTLILWDLVRFEAIRTFRGHSDKINSTCIGRDGRRALSGSNDNTLILWDLESRKITEGGDIHGDAVQHIGISANGRRALSGSLKTALTSYTGNFILWDAETGKALCSYEGHAHGISAINLSADGRFGLTSGWDKTLILWDLASNEAIRYLKGHDTLVTNSVLTPDAKRALSVSDFTFILWDMENGEEISTFKGPGPGPGTYVDQIYISEEGREAISVSGRFLILWDAETGEALRTFEGHFGRVQTVKLSLEGWLVLSISDDDTAILWEVRSGRKVRTFKNPLFSVDELIFSKDGWKGLSCSDKLILWDFEGREVVARLFIKNPISCFSIIGNRIAYGDMAGQVYFLELPF